MMPWKLDGLCEYSIRRASDLDEHLLGLVKCLSIGESWFFG